VSGLLLLPPEVSWLLVLAHGAGAGMKHRFMERLSSELAAVGIGTFRYQFPYMEAGRRRPDQTRLGERGVVDLIALMGYYHMVSMLLNVDRYPLPDGAKPELKPLGR